MGQHDTFPGLLVSQVGWLVQVMEKETKKSKKMRKGKRKKQKCLVKPGMSAEEKAEIRMQEKLPEPLDIK